MEAPDRDRPGVIEAVVMEEEGPSSMSLSTSQSPSGNAMVRVCWSSFLRTPARPGIHFSTAFTDREWAAYP